MGSKKESPAQSQAQAQAQTAPTSERTYINGKEVSSRLYNDSNRTYTDNIYLDPLEERALNSGKQQFADLLDQIRPNVAVNEQERQKFQDSLYQPQASRLKDEYFKTLGDAQGAANASGVMDSVGFENFRANQLDKNLMQGLSDLQNQSYLQSYDLPNLKLQPLISALSVFDTSINSPTQRALSLLDPSFQGSQAGSNNALQRFQAVQNRIGGGSRSFGSSLF